MSSPNSPSKRKNNTSDSSDELSQEGRYRPFGKIADQGEQLVDKGSPFTSSNLAQNSLSTGKENQEMIMGIDPSLQEQAPAGHEMQERGSLRMMSTRTAKALERSKPADTMDLAQVMEDYNVATESGAVRHAGFLD